MLCNFYLLVFELCCTMGNVDLSTVYSTRLRQPLPMELSASNTSFLSPTANHLIRGLA